MLGLDNPLHIAFLFVLLLLVFGAKRLPELGHSLGAGLRGFKESISGESPAAQLEPARGPSVTTVGSAMTVGSATDAEAPASTPALPPQRANSAIRAGDRA
jgi:sec-independent protein translocase protein TatA